MVSPAMGPATGDHLGHQFPALSLKQRRGDLLDRLEKLARAAESDPRLFTAEEQAESDRVQREIADFVTLVNHALGQHPRPLDAY